MSRSYFTNKEHTHIAFVMAYGLEGYDYKIVIQNRKNRSNIKKLIHKKFTDEYSAQEKLDKIAEAYGWDLAFTS